MFIDINSNSINCHGDRICGDTFMQRYIPNQRRTVAVLSDGMGHGIKAGILSTLTASIIVNMGQANQPIRNIAYTILKTLPVCQVRGISYSTFTIVDIDHNNLTAQIIEYDNPQTITMRGAEIMELEREKVEIEGGNRPQTLYFSKFAMEEGDRIIACSDGVTQAGLGTTSYPFGWKSQNLRQFLTDAIAQNTNISSLQLSLKVLNSAWHIDQKRSKDDISCSVFTFRPSRRLLLCSCPPITQSQTAALAARIREHEGKKVICGYPLAEKIASALNSDIRKNVSSTDPNLPPLWFINGVDLVTEGFLTLTKVNDILESEDKILHGRGPAFRVVKMLMEADHIQLAIGMQDSKPTGKFVDNFELRRKLLERMATLLETRFSKAITKEYV